MSRLVWKVGLAASVLLMACGDDGGSSSDVDADLTPAMDADLTPAMDAAPMLTGLDAFCAPGGAYELLLETRAACRVQPLRSQLAGTGLTEGAALEQSCHEIFGPMVADATVSFDDTQIQGCLDYLGSVECLEIPNNLNNTPCSAPFVGTVATDGDCNHDNQCAGDAFCRPVQDACNRCEDLLALDADCVADVQCLDGACNSLGKCAAPIGLDGDCTGDEDCAGVLVCSPVSDTCVSPFPQQGDPCAGHAECTVNNASFGLGLYCLPGSGGPGSCEPLPALGQACGPNGPGGQPICDFTEYLWCDTSNNTCAAPASSALDGACNAFAVVGFGARQCVAGALCTNPLVEGGQSGTCVTPGYEGESCTMVNGRSDCYPGYTCASMVCEAPDLLTDTCPAP